MIDNAWAIHVQESSMSRLITTAVLATLLVACAAPSVGIRATDGGTIALVPGQVATLANGGRLRYLRLVNDSRCAPDVQCVWAGDAVIELHWVPVNGADRDLQLHFNTAVGPNHADLDGRRVTFTNLSREGAQASLKITPTP